MAPASVSQNSSPSSILLTEQTDPLSFQIHGIWEVVLRPGSPGSSPDLYQLNVFFSLYENSHPPQPGRWEFFVEDFNCFCPSF